jgi:hypothetical protein
MKNILASLVYDSWTEPIPELRSTALRDRHLIFEGDGVILDLLLKKTGDAACIHVGGQVLPGDGPLDSVADVQVIIEQGSHRSSTHTNALGEFAFHTVTNRAFDLSIILKGRRFQVRGLSSADPRMWCVVAALVRYVP